MAGTIFGIPFDEELFIQSWNEAPDPYRAAMIESGAVVEDSLIAARIQNEGSIYTIPFYETLSGDDLNYNGQTDITATETSGGYQTGVVYGRAKAFFARNFTAELSGSNPMGFIAGSIAKYWQKKRQLRMIGILNAIFGISGVDTYTTAWLENHTADLSSDTATPYLIGATDLNSLATQALGDNKAEFKMAIMHSNVAKTLENLEVLEYWKQTDANGIQRPVALASANGFTVIIDDGVPAAAVGGAGANSELTAYTTYLLGGGVIRTASGRVDVPVEAHRDPAKNGGQDTLYTRLRETIHPNGFSFIVPSTGWTESPTDTQLFASANWNIEFDPKSIAIAKLITNG